MAQLSVGTETTPLELADFFRRLDANDTVSGKQGNDGQLVLYTNPRGQSRRLLSSIEERTVTRVAVEVVLQPLGKVVGAELALRHVQSALERSRPVRVGDVRGPLGVLADLYGQSVKCSEPDATSAGARVQFVRQPVDADGERSGKSNTEGELSEEQRQILATLMDRLVRLSGPPSSS